MRLPVLYTLIFLTSLGVSAHSSDTGATDTLNTKTILVTGKVLEKSTGTPVFNTIIIQKGVGGKFLDADGTFKIRIQRKDTLLVSATGYGIRRFCFEDSVGSSFNLDVRLEKLKFDLAEHIVMPKRTVSEIKDDLEDIRLTLPDRPTGANALSSPITAIYAAFSKMERSKRLVAEMEYKDQRDALLKELFRVYVDADIINLSPDEFERFIYYSNVSDDFLRSATEYELITFFQQRYKEYIAFKR